MTKTNRIFMPYAVGSKNGKWFLYNDETKKIFPERYETYEEAEKVWERKSREWREQKSIQLTIGEKMLCGEDI